MRHRVFVLFAVAAISAIVWPTVPAQTQANVASSSPVPETELDALLAARNWNTLGAALSQPGIDELIRRMRWMKAHVDSDGGFFLATLYARDLWALGGFLKADNPEKDVRYTAALISLYAYELIVIDGAKCEDWSAPSNRLTQLMTQRSATLAFLKQLPSETKSGVVDVAIALERKTAPLRKDDDLMCRGGLAEIQAGLEKGTQQETPNTKGYVGKTIAVSPPSNWSPKFVTPDVYRPKQDKARAGMREDLLKFVGFSDSATGPKPQP